MNATYIYALLSVSVVGLIALAGVAGMAIKGRTLSRIVRTLIPLATGAMLGNAIVHLVPESFENTPNALRASILIASGFVGCFILVRIIHLLGGDCADCHEHEPSSDGDVDEQRSFFHIHPSGHVSLISHALDNFCDGILIALSYLISFPVGLATTISIILHEIPMEFSGFGVLVMSGFSRKNAIWVNFLSALVALAGTLLTLWLGTTITVLPGLLTPVAAGAVLYNAASTLVPQLQRERGVKRSVWQLVLLLIGLGLMIAVRALE
jgi:zinc and cadmium transporter